VLRASREAELKMDKKEVVGGANLTPPMELGLKTLDTIGFPDPAVA